MKAHRAVKRKGAVAGKRHTEASLVRWPEYPQGNSLPSAALPVI